MVTPKKATITTPMAAKSTWLMRAEVSTPRRFSSVNSRAKAMNHQRGETPGKKSSMALPHQMVQISGLIM